MFGSCSRVQWPTGHPMTIARPTTESSETVPLNLSVRWYRESAELPRWSPSTNRRPAGTFTSKEKSDGLSPA